MLAVSDRQCPAVAARARGCGSLEDHVSRCPPAVAGVLPAAGATPLCLAVSLDGTRVVGGEGGRTWTETFAVRTLKLGSGEVLHAFADHLTSLSFAPDGGHLLTGLRDVRLLLRDLPRLREADPKGVEVTPAKDVSPAESKATRG